jgi:hypothetical protein
MGTVELALPEVFQAVGGREWVVALPGKFEGATKLEKAQCAMLSA